MAPDPQPRVFDVVAWPADRRLVVYVPEIEASTTVRELSAAPAAAAELIADLTGLDPTTFSCEVRIAPRRTGPLP